MNRTPVGIQRGSTLSSARSNSKLIQIATAFPTRFCSGTKPQKRLSALLSRLSPITK
ncbi:Uncharacterised protein [Vibrio cholerae]|nr:Uncharacterised protein [Vibrio cholerae]